MMKSLPKPGRRHEFRTQKLSALAKALGVSQAKLKAALKSQRGTLKPDMGAFTAALAKELGVSEAKVKSAFPAGAGPRFEFRHRMGRPGGPGGPGGPPPAGYPGTTPGAGPPPAPPSGNPI